MEQFILVLGVIWIVIFIRNTERIAKALERIANAQEESETPK